MKCFSLKIIYSFKLKQHEINKTIKELKQTKIAKKNESGNTKGTLEENFLSSIILRSQKLHNISCSCLIASKGKVVIGELLNPSFW